MKKNRLSILALAPLIAGCSAVGPDCGREEPPVPVRFSAVEPGIARGAPVPGRFLDSWWCVFEDSLLDSPMERLVSRNRDLRVAAARLMQARAYQSSEGRILFQDLSSFRAFGPTLRWPILIFLRTLSQIDVSKAVREDVLARYEHSVLLVIEAVENALLALSREKNRSGSRAEAALYAAEDQLALSQQAQALALVALYKALGGSWPETVSSPGAGPDLTLRRAAPVGKGLMKGRTKHIGWKVDE